MRFKIDWASLIVGSKFIVFALFYFVCEGNFQAQAPGGFIFGGAIYRWVLRYRFGGLIFGGDYTWRGLFSEFYGIWLEDRRHRIDQKQERNILKNFFCSILVH